MEEKRRLIIESLDLIKKKEFFNQSNGQEVWAGLKESTALLSELAKQNLSADDELITEIDKLLIFLSDKK